jgi:hypothetical protein
MAKLEVLYIIMLNIVKHSKRHFKLIVLVGVPSALVLCAVLLLPALTPGSNCGGNAAALAACKSIFVGFQLISYERGEKTISILDLTPAEREYFKQIPGLSWLGDSKILVTTKPISTNQQLGREVLAVCNKPFDNVPRRMFGKAPLTHAVVYTDGSTDLLSLDEF